MKHAFSLGLFCAGLLTFNVAAHADAGHQHMHHGQHHDEHAAIGQPGKAAEITRTIDVDMSDAMRFSPPNIAVKRGETIRFRVKNSGAVRHELVLGTLAELKTHAGLMRKFPEMEHDDPNMVQVDPGKSGELIWKFDKTGTFDFACLQPGHFEAGMAGKVAVK